MSERDEMNIDFVLSLNANKVREWISSMDKDDLQYALSIIECARYRLVDDIIQDEDDCTEACNILNKIWNNDD